MPASTLQIPPLLCFTLPSPPPGEGSSVGSLGLQIHQSEDDSSVEVARVAPGGHAASHTPLRRGCEILSINDHRVRDAARCVEMLRFYSKRGTGMEIVASAGARPAGALYVMVKRERRTRAAAPTPPTNPSDPRHGPSTATADPNDPGDGSFRGLFLEDGGGRVRVSGLGGSGMFAGSKINRGDVLLSIDGRPIHGIHDCERALKKATRNLIPVLTYNLFRKFRSGIAVNAPSTSEGDAAGEEERECAKKLRSRCVGDLYAFGPTVGSGGFSVVKKCKLKETGETFAMKIVNRRQMDKGLELALKDEIAILNSLNHPHIIRLYDTFATINSYYLVTEYLDGGELFDRIVKKTTYTEKEARDVCSIIFGAVEHCHRHRVAHRDLKPENLLLRDRENDLDLKIADFGFSRRAPTENSLGTICGSPGYVSPEILKKVPYGTKTDMWSIGVIVFILMGGYPPFQDAQQSKQFENIKKGKYTFLEKYWGTITDEAKSLIDSLLRVDPGKRLSAGEAMDHPWMRIEPRKLRGSSLLGSVEALRQFNIQRKFKSAVQSVIFLNRMSPTKPSDDEVENGRDNGTAGDDGTDEDGKTEGSNAGIPSNGGDDGTDDGDEGTGGLNAVFSMRPKEKSLYFSSREHQEGVER